MIDVSECRMIEKLLVFFTIPSENRGHRRKDGWRLWRGKTRILFKPVRKISPLSVRCVTGRWERACKCIYMHDYVAFLVQPGQRTDVWGCTSMRDKHVRAREWKLRKFRRGGVARSSVNNSIFSSCGKSNKSSLLNITFRPNALLCSWREMQEEENGRIKKKKGEKKK